MVVVGGGEEGGGEGRRGQGRPQSRSDAGDGRGVEGAGGCSSRGDCRWGDAQRWALVERGVVVVGGAVMGCLMYPRYTQLSVGAAERRLERREGSSLGRGGEE